VLRELFSSEVGAAKRAFLDKTAAVLQRPLRVIDIHARSGLDFALPDAVEQLVDQPRRIDMLLAQELFVPWID
jgi:hypothetical protein